MADAQTLAEFMVEIGFRVDAGQQRRLQEALINVEKNVTRFSRATHQSTGFLGQFFQFFQKSEGPMRGHTETTNKLTKSFEEFEKSLKSVAGIVASGALVKGLLDLTQQFEDLYYSAQQAGTSVANLMAAQFGAGQVGISAAQITTVLTSLRHALQTIPGAGAVLGQLGVDVTKFLDPATGKINDMTGALDALLPQIAKLYEQGAQGAARANAILGAIGITPGPEMERFFSHLEQVQKFLREEETARGWAKRLGVDLDQAAANAVEVQNRFDDIWYILKVLKGSIEETFGPSAAGALEWFRDGLLHLVDVAKEASAGMREAFKSGGFEGLGKYITQQLDAIDWNAEGAQIAQNIIDGIGALFSAGAGNQEKVRDALIALLKGAFDQAMNDLRGWMAQHGLDWFPGVVPRPPPTVPAVPGSIDQAPGIPADPAAEAQVPRQYQQGGIVPTTGPAMLHAGEGVVTADAMSGLSRLGPTIEDLWDGFRNWWFGAGGYRPGVVISNVDELAEALSERKLVDEKTREAGAAAGDGGGAGAGGGTGGGGEGPIPNVDIPGGTPRMFKTRAAMEGNFRDMANYLSTQYGLDRAHVLGFLGNVMAESEGEPWQATGPAGERGILQENPQSGGLQRMLAYLKAHGKAITDIHAQIDFEMQEIRRQKPRWFDAMSAAASTRYLEDEYERPAARYRTGRFREMSQVETILGSAPLGTTNSYRAGDKTVTLNAQNNFSITGADALSVGGAINSAQSRINADLIRNLSPIVQ